MIQSLRTAQFRNLQDRQIEFSDGWSLLVGDNGGGKTSILEAAYLTATSKSFRSHRLIDCCAATQAWFRTEIECQRQGRYRQVVAWDRADGLRRAVNDSQVELAAYLDVQPVVAYTARDADLLDGAPAGRRRFLDSNLVAQDPSLVGLLARVRTVVESKRAALARRQPVEPWNELLAPAAARLQGLRRELVADLNRRMSPLAANLGMEGRNPRLGYSPSTPGASGKNGEDEILAALNQRLDEERECGYPLWGPQRDDWRWSWGPDGDQIEVKRRSSRGEKKALTLALFAAGCQRLVEHGREPTLLVDDLDAELDASRQRQVCQLLLGLPQVIATSSRLSGWEEAPFKTTHGVRSGAIEGL